MNVKSKILKLSIIFMLILVLIPVIAAEDSSEAFYIEYAEDCNDDVIVEESYSTDEVESAQEHTFISNENDDVGNDYEDLPTQTNHFEEAVEDNCDANINIIEHVECSADVSQDIQLNEDINYICSDDFADLGQGDIFENSSYELTTEDISVINQGLLFISKNDFNMNIILIKIVLDTETTSLETTSFDRGISKILELKNNILVTHNVRMIFLNDVKCDVSSDIVSCINKATSDFVFSIDNSVIGDENGILIVYYSFLKFNPSFYAYISCDFLTVDDFFGGDCIIASELFCDFVVEHRENDLSLENFQIINPISGLSDI